MGLPQNNPEGYVNASVSSVEGFKNVDFLLAHGMVFLVILISCTHVIAINRIRG